MDDTKLFPKTYEEARARFRADLAQVRALWPEARLEHRALRDFPDLTTDWIWAEARRQPRVRLILSAGEHGVEGYVGSAMLHLFVEEFLPRLDPDEVGLLLIHVINSWGMAHRRRVNPNNVDLNRNFLDPEAFRTASEVNPAYTALHKVLNPSGPVRWYPGAVWAWKARLLKNLISPGEAAVRAATLLGQYRFPQGLYYGGDRLQEETLTVQNLLREAWQGYAQVVHLDMHTGYGPREQMTLVNSPLEPRPLEEFKKAFGYPHVVATEPGEFYAIHGDMMDWAYRTAAQEAPGTQVYAAAFEFGTLGAGLAAAIRSLQAMVFENRAFWYGASAAAQRRIEAEFLALFYPQEAQWQRRAAAQARQAWEGILQAYHMFKA